jgi:uncharacterized membrane protein YhhN
LTVTGACLLGVFGAYALGDWWAVETGNQRLEYLCKPTALLALTFAAVALEPADDAVRAAFVVALVLSLAGDVFLMVPGDHFVPGLAAFLAAHVAYVVGFVIEGQEALLLVLGLVVVAVGVGLIGRRLIGAVRAGPTPELVGPVMGYVTVISAMVATAIGSGNPVAIAGGLSFYASDALLGWNRFAGELPHARLAVMVTYHLGQFLLVLSLLH